ncbi:MAG: TolB family protein [Anaerolineales bacterium]
MPTQQPTPTRLPFSKPRQESHRILLTHISESEQTVWVYDYELNQVVPLTTLPADISLYVQEEPEIDPDLAHLYEPLPNGLPFRWLAPSPDGTMLATLQPALGGMANYIHQIDLLSGEILSIQIMDGYEWTIPIVPGRTPTLGPPVPRADAILENASDVFWGFDWAPDSSGFTFTIRTPVFELFEPDRYQFYYVERGSTEVLPWGSSAPGTTVGEFPLWSPDGSMVAYLGDLHTFGIWVVQSDDPTGATQLTDKYVRDLDFRWSDDGKGIYYERAFTNANGDPEIGLFRVDVTTGDIEEIYSVIKQIDEEISFGFGNQTPDGDTLIISEVHRVAVDPLSSDPEFEYDPARSKMIYIKDGEITELGIYAEEARPLFSRSPTENWINLKLEPTETCMILSLPEEEIILGPDSSLCKVGSWSPDGHLLSGVTEDGEYLVFDLDTKELVVLPIELDPEGIQYFRWIQEPSVYDEIVEAQAP